MPGSNRQVSSSAWLWRQHFKIGHDSHADDDHHHGEDDDDEDDDVSICTVAWYSLRPVDHKGVDVVELKKSQFLPKKSKHCNNCDNKHYNKPSKPCNTHSNLEVLEGLHDVRPHVLRTVVGVPQLGLETQVKKRTCHREFSQILSRNSQSHLNKQLLPLDDPSGKELLESLPDDVLVVVVVGAVQHPVPGLHCRHHCLLRLLSWCLDNITMIRNSTDIKTRGVGLL